MKSIKEKTRNKTERITTSNPKKTTLLVASGNFEKKQDWEGIINGS